MKSQLSLVFFSMVVMLSPFASASSGNAPAAPVQCGPSGFSYLGSYNLEILDPKPMKEPVKNFELKYESHPGPDGDGESIELKQATAKYDESLSTDNLDGYTFDGYVLKFNRQTRVMTLLSPKSKRYLLSCQLQE